MTNWKDLLFYTLNQSSHTKHLMDRVERHYFEKILYNKHISDIKPIDTTSDLIFNEVSELRNKKMFNQASDLLEQEKNHIEKQENPIIDESIFSSGVVEVEEEEWVPQD